MSMSRTMRALTPARRDAGLRRLRTLNRVLVAAAVVATGLLTDVAANAFPGPQAPCACHAARPPQRPAADATASSAIARHTPAPHHRAQAAAARRRPPRPRLAAGSRPAPLAAATPPAATTPGSAAGHAGPAARRSGSGAGSGAGGLRGVVMTGVSADGGRRGPDRDLGGAGDDRGAPLRGTAGSRRPRRRRRRRSTPIDVAASRFRDRLRAVARSTPPGRAASGQPAVPRRRAAGASERRRSPTGPSIRRSARCLVTAGYDRDWRELQAVPGGAPLSATDRLVVRRRRSALWEQIELRDRSPGRSACRAGVTLDLGATAKALAADRAAAAAHAAGAARRARRPSVATSPPPARPPQGGWLIHVTDDHRAGPDAPGQTISIQSGGLATSSIVTRRWLHDGQPMHHILDPRPASPCSTPWRTVSVAAATLRRRQHRLDGGDRARGRARPSGSAEQGLPARLVGLAGDVRRSGVAGRLAIADAVGPSLYWYVTRASGAVALVLLTASVVIGIAAIGRLRGPGVPRFMIDGLHRTVVAAGGRLPGGPHPDRRARQLRADLAAATR